MLTYALAQNPEKASLCQLRQLSFIAQFACEIVYIQGVKNTVADTLSRNDAFRLPTQFDLRELANKDEELKDLITRDDHSLKLQRLTWGPEQAVIYCEMTADSIRPYIP